MACNTIAAFALNCTPTIGGIQSVTMKEHGSSETAVSVDVIPDSSTFNSVMTYDKTKNVKYWTSDVTLNIGELSHSTSSPAVQGSIEFVESLSTHIGIDVTLTMFNGKTVTIENMFVQTATWNDGPTKADAATGTVVLQAVNKTAPTIV